MLRSAFSRYSFALFFTFSLLTGCQNETGTALEISGQPASRPDTIRQEEVPTDGAVIYKLSEGTIFWSGQPAIGNAHTGTIGVSGGELLVNQGRLISGVVRIDMNSIAVTDIEDGGERRDLEGHLKHSDFFEVKNYSTGEFKFDEVLPSNLPDFNWVISGQLTLKGKTNPVNIPVKMTLNGDDLVARSPDFHINRTLWGINFHSGLLGTATDKLIHDMIILSLKVKGQKVN